MKKFINRPEDVVKEMMQGLAVLHSRSTRKVRVVRHPPRCDALNSTVKGEAAAIYPVRPLKRAGRESDVHRRKP